MLPEPSSIMIEVFAIPLNETLHVKMTGSLSVISVALENVGSDSTTLIFMTKNNLRLLFQLRQTDLITICFQIEQPIKNYVYSQLSVFYSSN